MPLSTIFQLYRGRKLMEATGVPGEKHRPVATRGIRTHNINSDRH